MSTSHPNAHRGRRRRLGALLAAGAVAAGAFAVGAPAPIEAAPTIDLQLLAFNDYHGHVEGGAAGSIDDQDAGGGEYLSAKLAELRAAAPGESLTVAAGDLIGGSPFFSGLFHDEPSIESVNAMGLDIAGVGNHEFDEGLDELIRMQDGGCYDLDEDGLTAGPLDGGTPEAIDDCYFPADPFQGAEFPYLAANVIDDGTGDPVLPPYEIRTVDGQQVAFIGMTLEGTDELVAASGIAGLTFEDEIATANALVPELTGMGVEAIFVLLHEGGLTDTLEIDGCSGISGPVVDINAGLDAEIDGIISGHTHLPYNCMLPDPGGIDRPVTSAYSYGRVVTEINMKLDDGNGEVDRGSFAVTNHAVIQAELTADPAITSIIDKWTPLAEAIGDTQVGTITADITRGGVEGSDRGVESAAGNLVADAQLAATQFASAQIAFMNPGGVRSDLLYAESDGEGDGVVTYGEAFTFQPFNNTLYTLPMTGAQIEAVLIEQCQPSDSSRPVLHLGVSEGFTYDLEITTEGGVCTDISVSNLQLNGVAIDPAATYLVTVNNFLADGGDNFDTFAEVAVSARIPGPQDIDALTDYLTAESPVSPPSTDRVNETLTIVPAPIQPTSPVRLLDTRDGFETIDGEFEAIGRLGAGEFVELQVAGRGGVADDADAVVLNIGAVFPESEGFLTVWPCDEERPLASNVNFFGGQVVSNAVLAKLSDAGTTCIYSLVATDLIADVNSEVPANGSPMPLDPARLLETRQLPGYTTIDGEFQGTGWVDAGETVELQVAGRGGVPADASAAVLNVGAVYPDGEGFLTIYPCGTERPLASSVNYFAGDVVSNAVFAPIGADGKVCIYTHAGTDLIADVNGEVPAGAAPMPVQPARLLETRIIPGYDTVDGEFEATGRIAAEGVVELDVAGRAGVPEDADLAVLNVTAIRPDGEGFFTVWPCDEDQPNASSVNFFAGDIVPNAVVAKLSAEGTVCIYTFVGTDMIVDVNAYSTPVVPFRPAPA